jgi:hypothetical protein
MVLTNPTPYMHPITDRGIRCVRLEGTATLTSPSDHAFSTSLTPLPQSQGSFLWAIALFQQSTPLKKPSLSYTLLTFSIFMPPSVTHPPPLLQESIPWEIFLPAVHTSEEAVPLLRIADLFHLRASFCDPPPHLLQESFPWESPLPAVPTWRLTLHHSPSAQAVHSPLHTHRATSVLDQTWW